MNQVDVIVVGGGPAGLAAAEACARAGAETLLVEQSHEIGTPTRTSGGSFIKELQALGIPEHLYHPIRRARLAAPHHSVTFSYDEPVACVIDVRHVFQYLAERAIAAGAHIRVATTATEPLVEQRAVVGVKLKDVRKTEYSVRSQIVMDATGYRAAIAKRAGLLSGFTRFGIGAEYDLYAPRCDQDEAVLIMGSQIAPAGYAWAFPWGQQRVRVGVGIIHADSRADPHAYLERLIEQADHFGLQLHGAEPVEYHVGLIPSDGLRTDLVGNGLMLIGDAAGQASTLVGEGIRWAIKAGQLAGAVAGAAIAQGDCSQPALMRYQQRWRRHYGMNLRLAHQLNKRMTAWSDERWDAAIQLLKLLTPAEVAEGLQTNLTSGWLLRALATRPPLAKAAALALWTSLSARGGQ